MPFLLALCTCPDAVSADRIAEGLVASPLAASVNVLPGVRSVSRWNGAVTRADEVLLLVKTTAWRFDARAERVVALHPSTLPEVIACDTAARLDRGLAWIGAETAAETAA